MYGLEVATLEQKLIKTKDDLNLLWSEIGESDIWWYVYKNKYDMDLYIYKCYIYWLI